MKQIDILKLALNSAMDDWARWDAFLVEHPDNEFAHVDFVRSCAQVSELFRLIRIEEGRAHWICEVTR